MEGNYLQGIEIATGRNLYIKMIVSKYDKFGRGVINYGFASEGDYLCILNGGEYKYLKPHEVKIQEEKKNYRPTWVELLEKGM